MDLPPYAEKTPSLHPEPSKAQEKPTMAHLSADLDTAPPYNNDTPSYSPSLEFYGLALYKMEFETPWLDNHSAVQPVVVELNSNQINLFEFQGDKSVASAVRSLFRHQNYDDRVQESSAAPTDACLFDGDAYGDDVSAEQGRGVLFKLRSHMDRKKAAKHLSSALPADVRDNRLLLEPTADTSAYSAFAGKYRGKLLYSYTLSNLAVGEAPSVGSSYYKEDQSKNAYSLLYYRNALRLRAEFSQFVLHFWSFHGMAHWFRNLCVGRDLASCLDARRLTTIKSIPRNFTVTNNALLQAAARETWASVDSHKRASVCSDDFDRDDCSCFTGNSTESAATAPSICSNNPDCQKTSVDINGSRIVCLENYYTPIEKQYISNCIPVLNSYDKWAGCRVTISDYEDFLPNDDKHNINRDGKVFISQNTFNSMAKLHRKKPRAGGRSCKEFFVDSKGLAALDAC